MMHWKCRGQSVSSVSESQHSVFMLPRSSFLNFTAAGEIFLFFFIFFCLLNDWKPQPVTAEQEDLQPQTIAGTTELRDKQRIHSRKLDYGGARMDHKSE